MTEQKSHIVFWAANFLALLCFISMNIYLPSIPTIEQDFHTTAAMLKLSITLFLIGVSISQFFWGSLSARYGRKISVILGLIFADIGTLAAMLAPNIYIFNTARLFEGIGIGSASVLCRALLTDALEAEPLARALSYVSSSGNIMPALAPIIGGYIVLLFNWRAVFLLLFLYTSTLIVIFASYVHETNKAINAQFNVKDAVREYFEAIRNRNFMGYLFPYIILSGGMIGYYAATPFIFITHLHIPAQNYAYLSIATVVSYIIGAQLSSQLRARLGFQKAVLFGIFISLISALILIIFSFVFQLGILSVLLPMIVYTMAAGCVAPTAIGFAMSELRHMAGASAAIIGAIIYASSAACTAFITTLNLSKLSSLAIYVSVCSLLSLITFWKLIIRKP